MAENQQEKKKSDKAFIWTVLIVALFIVALITNGFGLFDGNQDNPGTTSNAKLSIGLSPVLGADNASVTIYIFSDFSCPYCAAAAGKNLEVIAQLQSQSPGWTAPIPGVIENYVKAGKAKIIWKYYPGHGTAQNAQKLYDLFTK